MELRLPKLVADSLKELTASFLDLCLPVRCAGCETAWLSSREGSWCPRCLEVLPWIPSPLCLGCGRPFPKSAPSIDHLCGDCILSPPPYESARSATVHTGVVRDRIHQLKFGGQLRWVPPLAELLATAFHGDNPEGIDFIVPVPLHVKRLRQRGFNQSALISKALACGLHLPVSFHALIRSTWTEPQTRLSREERLQNVRKAFSVPDPSVVKGRGILVVDDVFTTGTTIGECARTLRGAGAARVRVLTVTRAVPDWKPEAALMEGRATGRSYWLGDHAPP